MFRYISGGAYYLQGGFLMLAIAPILLDYRAAVDDVMGNLGLEAFEAMTAGSNEGASAVSSRLEHCFIFMVGILLLIIADYVPIEQRGVPSAAIAACQFMLAKNEFEISSNTFVVPIYQGSWSEAVGLFAYVNLGFGVLHALVSIGTFAGLAKKSDEASKKKE